MKRNHKKCLECTHYKVHEVINGKSYDCDYIETKICTFFDLSYLMLLKEDHPSKKFNVNDLTDIKERIVENSKTLQTKIRLSSFSNPKNSSDFKKLLKKFHGTLLDKSKLKDVGNFRNVEIYFDTDKNRREGVDWSKIDYWLDKLWNELLESEFRKLSRGFEISYVEACWMSAHFLSQFFRIHPFRDANGRVGRFFVQFFMHQCGFSIIFKKELHKKYFKALRYSHRKFDEKELHNLTYKSCTYTTFINKYLFYYIKSCGSSTKIITKEELIDEQS